MTGTWRAFTAYDHAGAIPPNSVRAINPQAHTQAVALDAERRAGHVRGPLHGIPVLLKDNVGTKDQPTTAGSLALAQNVPKRDATVTKRLRDTGAVILGKANLAEFANWVSLTMPNGYSSIGGQVSSAYDGSNPSGSSSGSTVAMSLSLAAATIGSETAGSIISPANLAGVVGVKPSVGVVSRGGVVPLAESWDTTGPITKTVHDAALVLGAIAGPDPRDPVTVRRTSALPDGRDYTTSIRPDALKGVRIGWDPHVTDTAVFARARHDLRALGAVLVPTPWEPIVDNVATAELGAVVDEFKYGINHYLATEAGPGLPVKNLTDIIVFNQAHPDQAKYGQDLLLASDATTGVRMVGIAEAAPTIAATNASLVALFQRQRLDALIGPGDLYSYDSAASHWSSLVVPAGMAGPIPEGVQFISKPFTEARLFGYAAAFEAVVRGSGRVKTPMAINAKLVAAACK